MTGGRGGRLAPELLAPPGGGERRWSVGKPKAGDWQGMVEQLVRVGVQTQPDGELKERIVGAVERELIEYVLQQCGGVQVTAARRLGINRNTLFKKVEDFQRQDGPGDEPRTK
jgi:DNA-binding NtrC family response regulator